MLLVASAAWAQEIRYFYDEVGRLIGVVDQQGNAAQYVYDEVGNIIQIRRTNVADFPGPVAITFFDPDHGPVGTVVTIFGAGFSPVPANNQVTFNGVSASVTASTEQTITTEVPAGATTGSKRRQGGPGRI
jgi:YD repeat-containing protein